MSYAISHRSCRFARLGALVLVLACAALPEGAQGSNGGTDSRLGTTALISAPTAEGVLPATVVTGVAYVSMAPGTEPGGDSVTIQHLGDGPSVGTRMADGRFDPLAIEADAGDFLAIRILHANGSTDTTT